MGTATLVPGEHPVLAYSEGERRDYLTVVASMAFADGEVTDDEIGRIESMCDAFGLGEGSREQVIAAARDPDAAGLASIASRFAGSELRFALIVDLIDVAAADGVIDPSEERELEVLAEALGVTRGQLAMSRRYVSERRETGGEKASPETVAGLASVGIPAAALAVMAPLGAPLAAGLGVAAALGVGSFYSIRWLLYRIRGDHDLPRAIARKRREDEGD